MVRFSRVCLAAVPMCHPQVIKSRQWMRHDGGNTLQYQDPYEGLRALPLKVMECGSLHAAGAIAMETVGRQPGRGIGHGHERRPRVPCIALQRITRVAR